MSQITGGSVTYLRRVKTGDYEHKEAATTIQFSNGENEEDISAQARAVAVDRTNEALGIKPADAPVTQPSTPATAPMKPRATRGAAKPPTVQALPNTAGEAGGEVASSTTGGATSEADPFADSGLQEQITAPASGGTEPAGSDNGFDDDLLSPPAKEINDKELVEALQAHNRKVNNSPGIRALVGKYVAVPKRAQDIPQDQRRQFLDELAKVPAPTV